MTKRKGERKNKNTKGVITEVILFLYKENHETSKPIIASSTKDDKLSKEKALIQTVFFVIKSFQSNIVLFIIFFHLTNIKSVCTSEILNTVHLTLFFVDNTIYI